MRSKLCRVKKRSCLSPKVTTEKYFYQRPTAKQPIYPKCDVKCNDRPKYNLIRTFAGSIPFWKKNRSKSKVIEKQVTLDREPIKSRNLMTPSEETRVQECIREDDKKMS